MKTHDLGRFLHHLLRAIRFSEQIRQQIFGQRWFGKEIDIEESLSKLGDVLIQAPNAPIDEISIVRGRATKRPLAKNIPVALSTLANLSRIEKSEWAKFVAQNNIPISIRPRDASRDVIGKLLVYLEENDDARQLLQEKAKRQSGISTELRRAFQSILGE